MNGIYVSRAQRDFANDERARAQRAQRVFEQQATPFAAANMASYSNLYPGNSNEMGLSLVAAGVPASDPMVQAVAGIEQSQRATNGPIDIPGEGIWDMLGRGLSEFVMDPATGAARWGMMGLMSVYESTVGGAGLRAIQQSQETGRSLFGEDSTLYEQQPFVTKGLADVFRDPGKTLQSVWQESTTRDTEQQAMLESGEMEFTSNFGSGWFANSTVAPEVQAGVDQATASLHKRLDSQNLTPNQRYRAELEASPDIWREAVAGSAYQSGLGSPTTQQGYANREGVMFSVPSLRAGSKTAYTPWSPGRFAAATVFEPGTQNFAIASGIGDISAQIFADPMNLMAGIWAKTGIKGRTIRAAINEIKDNVNRGARGVAAISDHAQAGRKLTLADDVIEVDGDFFRISMDKSGVETTTKIDEAEAYASSVPEATEALTPQQAWEAYQRGELPYVPDGTIDMMDQLKLNVGPIHDASKWDSVATDALSPLDPPEEFVRAYHAAKKAGTVDPKVGGMSRKQFEQSYDDFFLPEGTADEFASADATNRLGQDPSLRTVTAAKSRGTNQKVRVYGKSIDLSGSTKPQDLPPNVRKVMDAEKMWYGDEGFVRNLDPRTGNPSQRFVEAMRKDGIGKVKLPDGNYMVLDDFIGGSKSDYLGSRIFFDNGNAPIFASDSARGAKVTPNQVNAKIDEMKALAKHALNSDGTIDSSKLTPEAMRKLINENEGLVDELERVAIAGRTPEQVVRGNRPALNPDQPYTLSGKQADNLVNDLWDMSQGDPGPGKVDKFFARMERKGVTAPRGVREAILEAGRTGTVEDVRQIVASWVGRGPLSVDLPGGNQYGRMRGMMGIIDRNLAGRAARGEGPMARIKEMPWVQRQMATMMPSKGLNLLDDPDAAYSQMVAWLDNYGMKRGGEDIERVLRRLRTMAPGDKFEGYQIMQDYSEVLFRHLDETTDGRIGPEFIRAASTFIEDTGRKHIYNMERVGQTDLGGAVGEAVRINGEVLHAGAMNMTSEAWSGAIHVPDPITMKRVAGYQTKVGHVANFLVSKKVYLTGEREYVKASKIAKEAREADELMAQKLLVEAEAGGVKAESKLAKAKTADAVSAAEKQLKAARKQIGNREKAVKERAKKAGVRQKAKDKFKTTEQVLDDVEKNPQRVEIHDRAGYLAARSIMNKIWKPLVLLRGAWTLRILMDDQMRVAADGMSMFNHPIRTLSYAMQQPKSIREAFKKGFIDINGIRVNINNIDEVQHGLMYQKAMMAIPDVERGKGIHGSRFANVLGRNDPLYEEGLTARLSQFGADPLGRRLALGDGSEEAVKDSVAWLRGELSGQKSLGVDGDKALQDLIELKASDSTLQKALQNRDTDAIERIVVDINAQMHRASGGLVVLDNGQGRYLSYADPTVDVTREIGSAPKHRYRSTEAVPVVIQKGDEDILAVLADGKGGLAHRLIDDFDNTMKNSGHKEFRSLVNGKLSGNADNTRYPSQVYGPDYTRAGGKRSFQEVADSAVSSFYEWLMTKPSDRLSRSPLFAARYWRSMGERLPFVDDDVAKLILKRADDAGKRKQVEWAASETKKWLGSDVDKVKGTLGEAAGANPKKALDLLDEQAKAAGLAEVEATLFNLTNQKNISDSLNLIFPFVEAWGEFATRWSRLMVYGDRNIKNMNRFQQTINGLRESDPFDPTGDQGFFHENAFGQEVFSYPAFLSKGAIGVYNKLAQVSPLGEIDPAAAEAIKMTGTVESLNFASGVIPGFGPVFQVGAKAALSDDPRWDGLKNIIAPFGTSGGAAAQFAPAWLKRVLSATGSEDPQLNAMYMSTVQDVIRAKIASGVFDEAVSKQDFDVLVDEAEEEARNLLFVRAAATWMLPSSPSFNFTQEDATGKVYAYSELGKEYRTILYDEAGGNDGMAWDIFNQRFGFLPAGFTQSKSYVVKPGPVTTEGWDFERQNPEFFDAYPNTAMYLMPDYHQENNEFNYQRYLEQLRTSEREQWTGEQMVALNDSMLGNMEWDHAMLRLQYLKDAGETAEYQTASMQVAQDISTRHPYWRQGIPGKRAQAPIEDRRAEVEAWTRDPNLRSVPVVRAVAEYIKEREFYLEGLEREYGLKSLDGSDKEYAIRARAELRGIAENIAARIPEFMPVFDSIYSNEVATKHDGWSDERVDFYNSETDLFEETLGISASTLPQFTNSLGRTT